MFSWQQAVKEVLHIVSLFKMYLFFDLSAGIPLKLNKMIPNGYLIFEDESFLDSTVAKMNALRKSGQFCDVRLQVNQTSTQSLPIHDSQAIKWIC